jgi:7,8-dihydropterin-6-yl-methyl-4-(beta-D-ribofuranosyl)aminobenzene 5'-phosphate synthase
VKQEPLPVRLTVVCDDFSGAEKGFRTDYGFALLVDMGGERILFDTGTHPDILSANLRALGLNATDLKAVILSHNHYDHTGGLPGILAENPDIPVYVHRDWDRPHVFKGHVVPRNNRVDLQGGRACPELAAGLHVTNSLFSADYGGIFEHACLVRTGAAEILITGCCHPGLDAFLDELYGTVESEEATLHIIGGFHGFRFSSARAAAVDSRLCQIICCHCTSRYESFRSQFGGKCRRLPVGQALEI